MPERTEPTTATQSSVFEEQFLETLSPHDAEMLRLVGHGFAAALSEAEPGTNPPGTALDPLREILEALDLSALRPLEGADRAIDRLELFVASYKKLIEELTTQCLAATRTLLWKEERLRQVLDERTLPVRDDLPPVTAAIAREVVHRLVMAFVHAMEGMAHWIHAGGTGRPTDGEVARSLLRTSIPLVDTLRIQVEKNLEIFGDEEALTAALRRVDEHLAGVHEVLEEMTDATGARRL